tara:strand:+ start:90 stop:485 length:396 start_codon:yes stop_codon:yes gene_type:complete
MENIFELNESQKNVIRNLHNSKKSSYGTSLIKEEDLNRLEDMDYHNTNSDQQDEDRMDDVELIFRLFDHKIGEWAISPNHRVTKETNDYLSEWKENAKSQINRILNGPSSDTSNYEMPGFKDTMDKLNDLY